MAQTFWYMSRLTFPLLDEESFTRPVIYTLMGMESLHPKQAGRTSPSNADNRNIPLSLLTSRDRLSSRGGDVMNGYGPPIPNARDGDVPHWTRWQPQLDRAQAITAPGVTSWVENSRGHGRRKRQRGRAVGVEIMKSTSRLPPTPKLTVVPASCMAPLWPSFSACCCSTSRIVSGRHAAERNASGCAVRRPPPHRAEGRVRRHRAHRRLSKSGLRSSAEMIFAGGQEDLEEDLDKRSLFLCAAIGFSAGSHVCS